MLDQQRGSNRCPEHMQAARGHVFSESNYPGQTQAESASLEVCVEALPALGASAQAAGVGRARSHPHSEQSTPTSRPSPRPHTWVYPQGAMALGSQQAPWQNGHHNV